MDQRHETTRETYEAHVRQGSSQSKPSPLSQSQSHSQSETDEPDNLSEGDQALIREAYEHQTAAKR